MFIQYNIPHTVLLYTYRFVYVHFILIFSLCFLIVYVSSRINIRFTTTNKSLSDDNLQNPIEYLRAG